MKTLNDWAEYYYRNGIMVYPTYHGFDWNNYNSFTQNINDVISYDWHKYDTIYGLAGKRGIRVIKSHIKDRDSIYISYIVKRFLSLLNLDRYPWVLIDSNDISIIINCPTFLDCNLWDNVKDTFVSYKGFIELPAINNKVQFYYHGIPTVKPAYVKGKSLENYFNVLKDDTSFLNKYINHLEK